MTIRWAPRPGRGNSARVEGRLAATGERHRNGGWGQRKNARPSPQAGAAPPRALTPTPRPAQFPVMRPTILALATGSVLAACAPRAIAPPSPAGAPSGSGPSVSADTQRITRDARSDQHRFERLRRGHLPYTVHAAPRRCDEVVGRFCLWHDDEDERWTARPESDAIRRGRERLLADLA